MGRDFSYKLINSYSEYNNYSVGRHNNYICKGKFSINELKAQITGLAEELKNEENSGSVEQICAAIRGYSHILEQVSIPNLDDVIYDANIDDKFEEMYKKEYIGAGYAIFDINVYEEKVCFDNEILQDENRNKRTEDEVKKIIEEYPTVRALYLDFAKKEEERIKSKIFDTPVVKIYYD